MRHLLSLCCLFLSFPLVGQLSPEVDTTDRPAVIVDNSDYSRFKRVDDQYYQYHYGNVQMRQDSVIFRADTAIKQKNDFIAWDNVSIQQGDSLSVFSDSLNYSGDSLIAYLHRNVSMVDRERSLFTEFFTYDLDRKVGWYETGGLLTDKEAQLYSKKGRYEVRSDFMFFKDSVRVTHPDFLLKADSLAYNMKADSVLFRGPTLMTFDSTRIFCERGYYSIQSQIGNLDKNAEFIRGDAQSSGDRIVYYGKKDQTYIIGNAFFQDSLRYAEADTILHDAKARKTYLIGNAYYQDQTSEASGARLMFNNETGEVFSSGRSSFTLNKQILTADTSYFSDDQGDGYARGGVLWQDTVEGVLLYSPEFIYQKEQERAVTKSGRPLFVFYEEGGDSLFMSADTIISYMDTLTRLEDSVEIIDSARIFQAYHNVRIWSREMSGVCDSLVYSESDSMFRMYYQPILWSDSAQISADTLILFINNGELNRMHAIQNAFMIEQVVGEYYNQVSSRNMEAQFEDGSLKTVWAIGNAMTYYYILDDADAFIGLEEAMCSEIKAEFDSTAELSQIVFYNQVDGKILPIEGLDPQKKRYKGFSWQISRKPYSKKSLNYAPSLEKYLIRQEEGILQKEKRGPAK